MDTLEQALQGLSWRLLRHIARRRGLRFQSNIAKAELVKRLAHTLPQVDNLRAAVDGLSAPQQTALAAIVSAGGRGAAHRFQARFGPIRPLPALVRAAQEQGDGDEPPSNLEVLVLAGLVIVNRQADDLFIAPPVLAELQTRFPPPVVVANGSDGEAGGPWPVVHDIACLLAGLYRRPARLLKGQWLSPAFLKSWGEQMWQTPQTPAARSEAQTSRRRFLHYLTVAAGLANSTSGALTPSPQAWGWFNAPPPEQAGRLWRAWLAVDPALWHAFRLPGRRWLKQPGRLLAAVCRHLPPGSLPSGEVFAAHLLAVHPDVLDLAPVRLHQREQAMRQVIAHLIDGPLRWLGVWDGGEGAHPPSMELVPPARPQIGLRLHTAANPLHNRLQISMGAGMLRPVDVLALAVLGAEGGQISAAGWVQALHSGWSMPNLLALVEALAGRSPGRAERATLRAWEEAAGRVRIAPQWVLETTDSAVISRLAASRRGRAHLVRTLSPRAVVADARKIDSLVRRLAGQEGVPPRVSGLSGPGAIPPAAYSWLALRVYQDLGGIINLPIRLPAGLLDGLAAQLDDSVLAAVEGLAAQTIDRLGQAIVGRAAFPPWPEAGLPPSETLPLIERAIAAGQPVKLLYYALSTGTAVRRVVEPHRVEWWGGGEAEEAGVPYLIGFCRWAQAERTFRVDRIREIAITPPD